MSGHGCDSHSIFCHSHIPTSVIPAKAGIHYIKSLYKAFMIKEFWIPAFAGMTRKLFCSGYCNTVCKADH